MTRSILWFRRDLRLRDHPALCAAASDGAVIPLVVLDPTLLGSGGRRSTAYLGAVAELDADLRQRGAPGLHILSGDPREVVPRVAGEIGASSVHVSAESTPFGRGRDAAVREALTSLGIAFVGTGTPYAVGPGSLLTGGGTPYQVFTPFSRAWRDHGWPRPAAMPDVTWATASGGENLPLTRERTAPVISERAALERWRGFLDDGLGHYDSTRNRPDLDATSRLSVQLKYGTIHPRTILAEIADRGLASEATRFVTELAWREFYADVLWHHPASAWHDLRPLGLDTDEPGQAFEAWRSGRTGYPIVDAGMRQLLGEGWMHNRVRMIVASFLVKDLHVAWQHGARHFLGELLDGDLASNSHGWQWVAGTGTDAAPYFRVFNPVTQGRRFDPAGDYVRRWVPELRHVAGPEVHEPWKLIDGLTEGYPEPIVDHAEERRTALARYEARDSRSARTSTMTQKQQVIRLTE